MAQHPNVSVSYQAIKAGLRQNGVADFSIFRQYFSTSFLVNKETLGPHTVPEASINFFRDEDDVSRTRPLFLIRNPVQTFNSWLLQGWSNFSVFSVAYSTFYQQYLIGRSYAKDSVMVVTAEALVDKPALTIEAICSHWGISFTSAMLRLEKPLSLSQELAGTQDFEKTKKNGIFRDVEFHDQIVEIEKPDVIPKALRRRIEESGLMRIYESLSDESIISLH